MSYISEISYSDLLEVVNDEYWAYFEFLYYGLFRQQCEIYLENHIQVNTVGV